MRQRIPSPSPAAAVLVALVLALTLAGCGGQGPEDEAGGGGRAVPVDLALDFTPNAVHAPIYAAVRLGLDRREGIRLRIRRPGAGPDALKLVASGRVAVGVLDIHDLAIARERGADLVGVGALVGRPLAALIARPDVRRPRDLEGRTVGVSGLPSDPAFLRAVLHADGGDLDRVRLVTIGFSAVQRLLTGRVDAAPAFWNAEGVALREHGMAVREFRVDDYGAPRYPEVVLMTARRTLQAHRDRVAAVVRALAAGIRAVRRDPGAAVGDIARAAGSGDRPLVRAELDAVAPAFADGLTLDRAVLERWADFDARIGLVRRRPDVGRAFAFGLAG